MAGRDTLQSLLVHAFGDWTMCQAKAEWVRDAIAHEPTRRILSEVGIPVQGPGFALDAGFRLGQVRTLANFVEAVPGGVDRSWAATREYGNLIALGSLNDLDIAFLDPSTGRVLGFETPDTEPFTINNGLEELLLCLAYVEVHRREDGTLLDDLEPEAGYAAAAEIAAYLATVDPPAFADRDESAWQIWIEDGFATGLFQDWRWDSGVVEYFLARGIDPTRREPRR